MDSLILIAASVQPLHFVLGARVVQADETPVALLDPGGGKTKKAYMWAYARGAFEPDPGVIYEFCTGRGGQFPFEFLTAKARIATPTTSPTGHSLCWSTMNSTTTRASSAATAAAARSCPSGKSARPTSRS